ncbi:MAG: response regulator transcription factor [Bacteroidetes Order II. Incertae sedis bacterium]|nr:response regulator transcription factor [Bacteroidetes Order II. bacterium]
MPIRLLIADDHPLMRHGIRNRMAEEKDIEVVAEAKDGIETIQLVMEHEPDVLLLDLDMPEANGMEVLEKLFQLRFKTRILILSAYISPHYVKRVLTFGVTGYLSKRESLDTIVEAVRGVASDNNGWSRPDIAQHPASQIRNNYTTPENSYNVLTGRERDVLIAAAKGLSIEAMADALCISVHTIRKHLSNIYEKIGVSDRSEAVAWAWKIKLMET